MPTVISRNNNLRARRRSPAGASSPARACLLALACLAALSFGCNLSLAAPPAPAESPGAATGIPGTLAAMQATQTALAGGQQATPTGQPPRATPGAAAGKATPTEGQRPVEPPGPLPTLGSISGRLTYPSGGIPPLRVVAFSISGDGQTYAVDTSENQGGYVLRNLPTGAYYVVAYTLDGKLAGGYSKAVACGLAVSCTDHELIPVAVVAGQDSFSIDPIDWYAPANAFPPAPWLPAAVPGAGLGSLSGRLSYPGEAIPALRVAAFTPARDQVYVVDTAANQPTFQVPGLPPGTYHVVAYTLDGRLSAGYTQAVPCGLLASCSDHSLIDVVVNAGQDTPGVDPGDWYAPPGAFPPLPGR